MRLPRNRDLPRIAQDRDEAALTAHELLLERIRTGPLRRDNSHMLIPKPIACAFCSMPSVNKCEFPKCGLPLCRRHLIRKFGGHLCWRHRGAKLVQYESLPGPEASAESVPSRRFRDAGVTQGVS